MTDHNGSEPCLGRFDIIKCLGPDIDDGARVCGPIFLIPDKDALPDAAVLFVEVTVYRAHMSPVISGNVLEKVARSKLRPFIPVTKKDIAKMDFLEPAPPRGGADEGVPGYEHLWRETASLARALETTLDVVTRERDCLWKKLKKLRKKFKASL
jgi:hypothetical protein